MKKLLHEKLRDGEIQLPDHTYLSVNIFDLFCERLADEIERYYIPRPRFEDGEPVQWGDCAVGIDYDQDVDSMIVKANGTYYINGVKYLDGEYVKRPQPNVYDADGVEIKKKEIVYGTGREQHRYKVLLPYDECNGSRFTVKCIDLDDDESVCHCDPTQLTHKEPDSIEKLLNDIREYLANGVVIDSRIRPWEERLSALIERGA